VLRKQMSNMLLNVFRRTCLPAQCVLKYLCSSVCVSHAVTR